jgi:hypothetical protein
MRVRILLVLVLVTLLVVGLAPLAGATPSVCGYVTVVILGNPVPVSQITYCNSCSNGIYQGPNDPYVWPVRLYSYECVRA